MDICSDSEFSPQDHKGFFSKSQVSSQKKPSDNGSLKVKKVFGEDEWSDSATSTEISFTQTSEGYCSSRVASKGILGSGFLKNKVFSHDTLSAPPMVDSGSEMSQSVDQIPILGGHHKPYQYANLAFFFFFGPFGSADASFVNYFSRGKKTVVFLLNLT